MPAIENTCVTITDLDKGAADLEIKALPVERLDNESLSAALHALAAAVVEEE